jgi:hypothetical protein
LEVPEMQVGLMAAAAEEQKEEALPILEREVVKSQLPEEAAEEEMRVMILAKQDFQMEEKEATEEVLSEFPEERAKDPMGALAVTEAAGVRK